MFDKKMDLCQGWSVCVVDNARLTEEITLPSQLPDGSVPASVPGDWPLDFVRAGLLPDPYYQDNYLRLRDWEDSHVFYALAFQWEGPLDRTSFRFEGIDTVADVYLNGKKIGHAENMYVPHAFAADGLREGENQLLVHIRPVALEARKHPIAAFESAQKYNYESLVIRKAAHMFGWDICPRIVSSGLWRPVSLVRERAERVSDVFVWIEELQPEKAVCLASFDVDIGDRPVKDYTLRLSGACGESRFRCEQALWYVHGRMRFDLPSPALWWPRGYGEANLYDITATLLCQGREVDSLAFRQGLRTVKLVRDDIQDENGRGDFCFVINGKRIYVQGTNWVPVDSFHSNDNARIPAILDLVRDVGCNAIRIWGGGVYESDLLYDICDESGILIWQDFMMACGIYPNSGRMCAQLEEEASVIVRRLRRHASICLWAGDNECDSFLGLKRDPAENRLTREILPRVLKAEDWTRPYLPSSPYVSPAIYAHGNMDLAPERHPWGPRDYFRGAYYRSVKCTFASEMGYHGCNSPESLYRFLGKEQAWPVDGNPMYLYHAASPELTDSPYTYRIPLMSGQLRFLFGREADNLDEYARMSQVTQAEAKKFFVESFRCRRPQRTGLIWWNIMDCWPQISDAVVDYYFCRKLAYFFLRRSQQPVCLMMDDHEGALTLYGVNDRLEAVRVACHVRDLDGEGEAFCAGAELAPGVSTALYRFPDGPGPRFYAIEWQTADGVRGVNHYLHGEPPFDFAWYMRRLQKMGFDQFEGFEK